MTIADRFRKAAHVASDRFGSPVAFFAAVALIVGWLVTGPMFSFSETWQLVINTLTTIFTFLMVFLIQTTQNRDARAVHLKLDELIRATRARNTFADVEDATEDELAEAQREFEALRQHELRRRRGEPDATPSGRTRPARPGDPAPRRGPG